MRIWMTGGTGFVGSNIVHQAVAAGHEVLTTYNSYRPTGSEPYRLERIDMTDPGAVSGSVRAFAPNLVIHCAILNDLGGLYRDRAAAWRAYVEATRSTSRAAHDMGAVYVLVSTDWVFDGTQTGADESTPPNPVNLYGVLKLASEMVALDRGGAVARVSGVNGLHRARPASPRAQDPGYGYFVASIVDALSRDRPYTVWESDRINMVATPSLASESADLILDIGARGLEGVFHCCGADAIGRMDLAHLTCEVFGLDPDLLRSGPPDLTGIPRVPIPYDTTIACPRTSELLDRTPTPVRALLARFLREFSSWS
jgi:dTDP-4-dehydrorhamnose reductase